MPTNSALVVKSAVPGATAAVAGSRHSGWRQPLTTFSVTPRARNGRNVTPAGVGSAAIKYRALRGGSPGQIESGGGAGVAR